MRLREIADVDGLARWLDEPGPAPAAVQALDLSAWEPRLRARAFPRSLFLGCPMSQGLAAHLVSTGATVIGPFPERSFAVHRSTLYTPEELFSGFDPHRADSFLHTLDFRIYEEYLDDGGPEPHDIGIGLAHRLHDFAIAEAVADHVAGRRVVAFMGGHGMERASSSYLAVATMARRLCREGFFLASGGGPGAMEATHVGCWFAPRPDADLVEALSGPFSTRPTGGGRAREYADADWLHRAMALRERYPVSDGDRARFPSLGVPTWAYGHEPPAAFPTHVAKYFANSIREAGLLALARHGVVFAPGSAGTIQEIFQDLTQNHYGTLGVASPMVLFDRDYWTRTKPVWPLLERLKEGRAWGDLVWITSDPDEVVERLRSFRPSWHRCGTPDLELESLLRRELPLHDNLRFVHVGETAEVPGRDLDDDQVLCAATARLVARGLRRRGRALPVEGPACLPAVRGEGPAAMAHWLEGLPDDWLPRGRAMACLQAAWDLLGIDEVIHLPDAPVECLLDGGLPLRGLLVLRRGRRLSLWAAELLD